MKEREEECCRGNSRSDTVSSETKWQSHVTRGFSGILGTAIAGAQML